MNTQPNEPATPIDDPRGRTAQIVGAWMSTPAITISPDTQLSEALALMHEHTIRRLPIVDDHGTVCGIITDGDIRGADVMRATGMNLLEIATMLRHTVVYDVMTPQPITVTEHTPLRDAAVVMLDNKVGGLPVVNARSEVVGILTESDLFEALVCYLDHDASIDGDVHAL